MKTIIAIFVSIMISTMYTNILLMQEFTKLNKRIVVLEMRKEVDTTELEKRLLVLEDKFQQWHKPFSEIFK